MAKLLMTVEQMQDKDKWLEIRNTGIGGSDISSIMGMSKFKSAYKLWLEKTGRVEQEDLSDNEYVYWGTKLESLVANRFCEITGKKVMRKGMMCDEKYPFLLANVDRMVVGEDAGLECKTANAFVIKEWQEDELPDAYYLQCQWYLMVTGCKTWYIAALIGGNHFIWKEVERNEEVIETIRKAAIEFWNVNVIGGKMPPVDDSEDCSKSLIAMYPDSNNEEEVELPPEMADKVFRLDEYKNTINLMSKQKKLIENEIKAAMGENGLGTVGHYKISWKTQNSKPSVDTKLLQQEYPIAYSRCVTQNSTRVLRTKEIRNG